MIDRVAFNDPEPPSYDGPAPPDYTDDEQARDRAAQRRGYDSYEHETDNSIEDRILRICRRESMVMRYGSEGLPPYMVCNACLIGSGEIIAEGETWEEVLTKLEAEEQGQ